MRQLSGGTVVGAQRLITVTSGRYAWPDRADTVHLYRYDSRGDLLDESREVEVATEAKLAITVPPGGLAIAELPGGQD